MTSRVSIKAILAGTAVDFGLTLAVSVAVYVWVGAKGDLLGLAPELQAEAIVDATLHDPAAYPTLILLGCACSVIGGYVAAKIARVHVILNGALSASLCSVLGVLGLLAGSDVTPLWQSLAVIPLGPALGALGAVWWRSKSRHLPRTTIRRVQASWLRRTITGVSYAAVISIAIIWNIARFISWECLRSNECTPRESSLFVLVGVTMFVVAPLIIASGFLGVLPGARRQSIVRSAPEGELQTTPEIL